MSEENSFAVSFIAIMWLVRKICNWLAVQKESWINAASLLILPTLVLDSFSCLYFARVFPNIDPAAAGAFGGWMLICCGGGIFRGVGKKMTGQVFAQRTPELLEEV